MFVAKCTSKDDTCKERAIKSFEAHTKRHCTVRLTTDGAKLKNRKEDSQLSWKVLTGWVSLGPVTPNRDGHSQQKFAEILHVLIGNMSLLICYQS